jgi:hypothetical protein
MGGACYGLAGHWTEIRHWHVDIRADFRGLWRCIFGLFVFHRTRRANNICARVSKGVRPTVDGSAERDSGTDFGGLRASTEALIATIKSNVPIALTRSWQMMLWAPIAPRKRIHLRLLLGLRVKILLHATGKCRKCCLLIWVGDSANTRTATSVVVMLATP